MKRVGYLLIEMLISLTMMAVLSGMIALLQSYLVCWHKEAEQYLIATTLAQKALAYYQTGHPCPIPNGFNVSIDATPINPQVPFVLHTATVSFRMPRGISKEITMIAGYGYAKT